MKTLARRAGLIGAIVATALIAYLIAQDPGRATLIVRGYEVEMSVAALAGFVLIVAGLIMGVFWVFGAPNRMGRAARRAKRERGLVALEDALIAAASGDARLARREARKAEGLLERVVASRLIAAQADEAIGDFAAAEHQYAGLLGDPRTAGVGRRGLAAAALARRDYETAILHAAEAFRANPGARWAFELLFDAQVRAARWDDAMITLADGAKRRHLVDKQARRRRAVLLAAEASSVEESEPHRARDLAEQSASISPAFAPGAALAARLLLSVGKSWRAASLLEDAWTAAPHPALALAYRDLKPDEPDRARAKRMSGLAELNASHRESRIVMAEHALTLGDGEAAAAAIAPVEADENEPSARLCGLLAQIAQARGRMDEARAWVRRAAVAPGEPDWSDLDPEGPAFAYTDEDWARLVYSYGDTGQLIHPRHERFEKARITAPHELLLPEPEDEAEAGTDAGPGEATAGDKDAETDAPDDASAPFDPERIVRGG